MKNTPRIEKVAKVVDQVNRRYQDEAKRSRVLLAEVLIRLERIEQMFMPIEKKQIFSDEEVKYLESIHRKTRIKDANGVDIREGDFVIFRNAPYPPQVYEVYWNFDRWGLRDDDGQDYNNGNYYYHHEIDWKFVEVIDVERESYKFAST